MRTSLWLACSFALAAAVLPGCRTPHSHPEPETAVHHAEADRPSDAAKVAAAKKDAGPLRITVVATNDLHGWVHPNKVKLPDGTEIEEGGAAAFAGYLTILRGENPGGVLLLDGGDLFQGTLASNLTEGEVVIEAMNRLGYTAAAIGNHEFDYGPVGPISVASDPRVDPFGALKARMAQAKFPILAVNIYDARTGGRPEWLGNDGTRIVEVHGVKIGLLGLTTPSTPSTTNPVNVSTLRFGSLVPEATEAAKKLRAKGAELVIAVAHAGGRCAKFDDPNDLSSCDKRDGEIFDLLENIPAGTFDLVVAGHTHAELAHYVNGMPVVETRGLGRSFSVVELKVDPKTHKLLEKPVPAQATPICARVDAELKTCDSYVLKRKQGSITLVDATFHGQPVKVDESIAQAIGPALEKVKESQQRKLGLVVPHTMGRNYEGESALGDFLADSLRALDGADIALLNPGGLRADLPAGELSYGEVYEVIPFDNTVATLTVTGEELNRLMHAAYGGKKGVFQVSGLKVTLAKCPGQGRLKGFALPDGRPIQPEKRYRVVVPDFLARGGDGLGPVVQSLPDGRIDLGMSRELNFRDALVAYWQKKAAPLVAPPSGRITFVDTDELCAGLEASASQ
ncbi:MAG: bifunctional metallophosphatase/5'-nucleotidase [Myxococcaceae bacterium]|nr:bifunctional metallophosphatase/5'-nucleotidase [Myxococcaceae bacterium]